MRLELVANIAEEACEANTIKLFASLPLVGKVAEGRMGLSSTVLRGGRGELKIMQANKKQ
jgi:hypothetical protein